MGTQRLFFRRPFSTQFHCLLRGCVIAVFVLGLGMATSNGQNLFLTIRSSAQSVPLNGSLSFTIDVTNASALRLSGVFVTNTLPAPSTFLRASTSQGSILTNAGNITFDLGQLLSGAAAQMTVSVTPTSVGFITNSATLASASVSNLLSTNIVTQVTSPSADLSISVTGPPPPVLVNDWITCRLTAFNLGPGDASAVVLSARLPVGMRLLGVQPSAPPPTFTNGLVLLSVGSLSQGANKSFSLLLQPTNSGVFNLAAAVSEPSGADTNTFNNQVGTNIIVTDVLPGVLIATNASGMTYNPQTGLMEQTVRLANVGASAVGAARVIVSGLSNWLYNASGTNNGHPFVSYNNALGSGSLILEYFVPARLPIAVPNSAYSAIEVPVANALVPNGTPFNVTHFTNLSSGAVLVEFQSMPGSSYTILYSDNPGFSNAFMAQPAIVAPADRVQWIDDGPPKTISAPASVPARFYRVLLNQ